VVFAPISQNEKRAKKATIARKARSKEQKERRAGKREDVEVTNDTTGERVLKKGGGERILSGGTLLWHYENRGRRERGNMKDPELEVNSKGKEHRDQKRVGVSKNCRGGTQGTCSKNTSRS